MAAWLHGCLAAWLPGCMDGKMELWMERWMDGWMAGWLDGWMDGWTAMNMHSVSIAACLDFSCLSLPDFLHVDGDTQTQ